jgi:hypothetical protein
MKKLLIAVMFATFVASAHADGVYIFKNDRSGCYLSPQSIGQTYQIIATTEKSHNFPPPQIYYAEQSPALLCLKPSYRRAASVHVLLHTRET